MSIKPQDYSTVPESTAQIVARNPRLRRSRYVMLRDTIGELFADEDFAALYPSPRGRPAESPAVLALVLILQFIEDLNDVAAAEAVATRADWKYLLGLPWEDQGFDASVLCEFRQRVVKGGLVALFLERVLEVARRQGLLTQPQTVRTDATHVLAQGRDLNRLECVTRTLQAALNSLAVVEPQWLLSWAPERWFADYDELLDGYDFPKDAVQRAAFANQVGWDSLQLLAQCYAPSAPDYLRRVPAIEMLRQVTVQQYYVESTPSGWEVRLRTVHELPPHTLLVCSPHDPEARWSMKGEITWLGYKIHQTETCDVGRLHLIAAVHTTVATTDDETVVASVHAALGARECLPQTHLVDAGYTSAANLVASQQDYGITLIGPVAPDSTWQAQRADGYALSAFTLNWERQVAICPQGTESSCWSASHQPNGTPVIHVRFPRAVCAACPVREQCTRAVKDGRTLTFLPEVEHTALQARRAAQQTPEFRAQLKRRAGIEGTLSQGVRAFGMRRSRYRGLQKTQLQHTLIAAGMNLMRMVAWLKGTKRRGTRATRFAQLGRLRAGALAV